MPSQLWLNGPLFVKLMKLYLLIRLDDIAQGLYDFTSFAEADLAKERWFDVVEKHWTINHRYTTLAGDLFLSLNATYGFTSGLPCSRAYRLSNADIARIVWWAIKFKL